MKNAISLLVAFACGIVTAAAQDLIVKRDASRIEAKVSEVAPDAVRYKRWSNPDGPTYVLPVAQIDYIRYANGETERFAACETLPATPVTPATPATPATVPAASESAAPAAADGDVEYVVRRYEIGEYYDRNGVRGVICDLSEDRLHGLVISLDELYLHWSEFRKPDLCTVGADDREDGRTNMERVAAYIEANGGSWADFPAFAWCREQGEGWYLPSIGELLTIGHNYNGGTRMGNNRPARAKFNDALKEHGGKRMDRQVYYFSSTEKNEKEALTTHMSVEPPYVVDIPKYNKFLVRAVHRF
ncbi:hypothetical protein [uncultured Parabacteroides sp.]|uniref:hypothetical protein n=1 Tax=uncultured Parabacteroides sp. TaxID=512312 RepID=UPI0026EEF5B9|nr:hypothetical protein [uncultured Parabacteroides sp.]